MTIREKMANAETIENAKAWNESSEKFTFCVDLLEISAHDHNADELVDDLEATFEDIINGLACPETLPLDERLFLEAFARVADNDGRSQTQFFVDVLAASKLPHIGNKARRQAYKVLDALCKKGFVRKFVDEEELYVVMSDCCYGVFTKTYCEVK